MTKNLAANTIYNLLNSSNIRNITGEITLTIANVDVTINSLDSVGFMIQEWLPVWLNSLGHQCYPNSVTQEFPDIYLSKTDKTKGLLEIKTFNHNESPAFDIANFESYYTSLMTQAYRLDADYLIFSYTMDNGILTIKNFWLKKIWEICCASKKYPLRVQEKRGEIYNIRPATWYSESAQYKPFENVTQFISALYKTHCQYKKNTDSEWIYNVNKNYHDYTGKDLQLNETL